MDLRTSDEWLAHPEYAGTVVLDPDGWDRKNFDASWSERITRIEFDKRLTASTIMLKPRSFTAAQGATMRERAAMALFDVGHRLLLSGGYFLQKQDDDTWQVGGDSAGATSQQVLLGFHITSNVPVGRGGSMDAEIKRLADANGPLTPHE